MKKVALVVVMCLMFAGCGNRAQTTTQDVTETATETETVVQSTEEITATTVIETVEETETTEVEATEELATEESTTEAETQSAQEVVVTPYEQPKTMYATNGVNVRSGPSTDYDVVSHLAMAQAVEVTGQADTGWYQFVVDGKPAYASNKYLSETPVEIPVAAPVETAQAQNPAPTAPVTTSTVVPAGVIMVGDSRCVQMQEAVGGGGCSWICENSKEFTWFSEVAIPRFDAYVGKGTKVVINMGVNDPEHYMQYVELINAKAAEWSLRGAKTYLVSVNPVWENPYTSQEEVDTFNANVPGMLIGVKWIDTSSWLTANGYRLVDGLHYDAPTYVNIFYLIMGSL